MNITTNFNESQEKRQWKRWPGSADEEVLLDYIKDNPDKSDFQIGKDLEGVIDRPWSAIMSRSRRLKKTMEQADRDNLQVTVKKFYPTAKQESKPQIANAEPATVKLHERIGKLSRKLIRLMDEADQVVDALEKISSEVEAIESWVDMAIGLKKRRINYTVDTSNGTVVSAREDD